MLTRYSHLPNLSLCYQGKPRFILNATPSVQSFTRANFAIILYLPTCWGYETSTGRNYGGRGKKCSMTRWEWITGQSIFLSVNKHFKHKRTTDLQSRCCLSPRWVNKLYMEAVDYGNIKGNNLVQMERLKMNQYGKAALE